MSDNTGTTKACWIHMKIELTAALPEERKLKKAFLYLKKHQFTNLRVFI